MSRRRKPSAAPRSRSIGNREPKALILVVCEGKKTEPLYLKAVESFKKSALLDLVVVDEDATTPKELVERACAEKQRAERERRRTRDPNDAIDYVWCVFDVDDHPKLRDAANQAADHDVLLAISNPCIELWFLLHFQSQTAYVDRDTARHALKSHLPMYSKGADCLELLLGRYGVARTRAMSLEAKHLGDETRFPDDNPSSTIYRLVDQLEAEY